VDDHERIEELLAGYALLSLSDEDAAEADRLLAEHVPTCLPCRQSLAEYRTVAGDLALAADPVDPPEALLARIRAGMDGVPLSRRRAAGRGSWLALAAGVVALAAMGGFSFLAMGRASQAEDDRTLALELVSLMRSPGVDPVRVEPEGMAPMSSGFVGVAAPDVRKLYLVADVCPDPAPGHAYQLWLGEDGAFRPVGPMFVPEGGSVLIELTVDVGHYDEVWITEEDAGSPPTSPSTDGRSWRAELA
jgi:Anti-sigma-K factor rskA